MDSTHVTKLVEDIVARAKPSQYHDRMTPAEQRYEAVHEYTRGVRFLHMDDGRTEEKREEEFQCLSRWLKDYHEDAPYDDGYGGGAIIEDTVAPAAPLDIESRHRLEG